MVTTVVPLEIGIGVPDRSAAVAACMGRKMDDDDKSVISNEM